MIDRTKIYLCGHYVDFDESLSEDVIHEFKRTKCEELAAVFSKAKNMGQGLFEYAGHRYGMTYNRNSSHYELNEWNSYR